MALRRQNTSTHNDSRWFVPVAVGAGILLLLGVLFLLLMGHPGRSPPPPTPIGSAFSAGSPQIGECAAGSAYASKGCSAGDYIYTLAIVASTVALDSVLFRVTTTNGTVAFVSGFGGFSILDRGGLVQAQSNPMTRLVMSGSWNVYAVGVSGSSPLTNHDTILIDMGSGNPAGRGYAFVAVGLGHYYGTTSPVTL